MTTDSLPGSPLFLLTRPMRDVTILRGVLYYNHRISTHTSHAGRDKEDLETPYYTLISTHTSHAGRDLLTLYIRLSAPISTHTSHAGRDRYILCLSAITHPHLGRTKLFIIRFLHFYGFCSSLSGEALRNSHITPPSHAHKNHTIMTPSGSYVFLAPTCSTLFFQLFPR